MRISPFPTARAMLRVFAKALILLIALDLVLLVTGVDPSLAITRVNLWSIAGKAGIPRLIAPSVYVRGQLPLDGQLAAHTIAYMPKAADEFRVIILGDSAQWGYGLNPEDTLTEQLNAHGLHMNSGKRIVVFNLGLPNFSVVRDTVILDGVTRYQPDLVLWFVTAASLMDVHSDPNSVNSDLRTFFHLNAARLDNLLTRFHQEWFAEASRYYGVVQPLPFWYAVSAVREQDALPVWFDALLLPFTAIAFDASLGMLIGTIARGRWLGILGQVVILLVRLVISSIALWIGALALSFSPLVAGSGLGISSVPGGGPLTWLGTLFGLTEGDLGLTLLHLPHLQRVWADIDYGILIGLAVLLYALLQAALSQAMIRLAAWRAAHADRV